MVEVGVEVQVESVREIVTKQNKDTGLIWSERETRNTKINGKAKVKGSKRMKNKRFIGLILGLLHGNILSICTCDFLDITQKA